MTGVTVPELMTLWSTAGEDKNATSSVAGNSITVEKPGLYVVTVSATFTDGTNKIFQLQLRANDISVDNIIGGAETNAGNETILTLNGHFRAAAGDVLTTWIDADSSSTFTLKHGNFSVIKIDT